MATVGPEYPTRIAIWRHRNPAVPRSDTLSAPRFVATTTSAPPDNRGPGAAGAGDPDVTAAPTDWLVPAEFPAPPTQAIRDGWRAADRAARPTRLARLRRRMAAEGVDAYFGVRPEHARYLTGFALGNGEEKVAGNSGQFLVGAAEVILLADSRYTIQARREAAESRIENVTSDLSSSWPDLTGSLGARRMAVEAGFVSHAVWGRLAAAAPDVELVPAEGWLETDRAIKEPAEVERIAAACAVADRALAMLLPEIRPGVLEIDLALRLEWLIRTGGGDALAFDVACLSGPEAALPHGAPGERPVIDRSVLLFDFGAQVEGYRSDMTRTLFVGEPRPRDLAVYELVRQSQRAAIDALTAAVAQAAATGSALPNGRAIDAVARAAIDADGRWPAYGHGLGHGIGLATHEQPSLSRLAPESALPSPTVFSVEPGIYLEGEIGVRIEDLVAIDAAAGSVRELTQFPGEVLVVR
jgi:Xaa-Pro aminopeptidase